MIWAQYKETEKTINGQQRHHDNDSNTKRLELNQNQRSTDSSQPDYDQRSKLRTSDTIDLGFTVHQPM